MSGDDEPKIPDVKTCQRLVEQFAEITSTDEALAQFYLQDRDWDVERSVNDYFHDQGGSSVKSERQSVVAKEQIKDPTMSPASSGGGPSLTTKPPDHFTFITWNIDGLDERNLKLRCRAVIDKIEEVQADIVFLQEVIPQTFEYMKKKLENQFQFIQGGDGEYFTATLLRRFWVYLDSFEFLPFPTSMMGRGLSVVEAHIGDKKLYLINSHLESTKDHTSERVGQLRKAFKRSLEYSEDATVIFAGDLNLRDKELDSIGGIPAGMEDVWISSGSRKECQYTWDMTRNSNLEFPGRFKPRCRFDRMYIRHSSPRTVKPKHFGLIGIEKVAKTQAFPSDHWGIICLCDLSTNN